MKLKLLLFSVFMALSVGTAWADVEINETNFPDENFRNYLLQQSYGTDGLLTEEEIAGVTTLNLERLSISNLKGIEFFTALKLLSCYTNELTSLDVSKNTELTELDCRHNQLTNLDVSTLTSLIDLACSDNRLTTLDLSKNTELKILECGYNLLTSLDVSKNTKLEWLSSSHRNKFATLDVSKNTELKLLGCSGTQLTTLNVANNPKLTLIECYENQIYGAGMDAFVESLPVVSDAQINVIYNKNEQNVMTIAQVAAAKAKGWTPCYRGDYYDNTNWHPYEGVDPAAITSVVGDQSGNTTPWYTVGGTLLSGKPAAAGIYIHDGRKVVVK